MRVTMCFEGHAFDGPRVRFGQFNLNPGIDGHSHRRMAIDNCVLTEQDALAGGECPDHEQG
jgi:hypothetical protein